MLCEPGLLCCLPSSAFTWTLWLRGHMCVERGGVGVEGSGAAGCDRQRACRRDLGVSTCVCATIECVCVRVSLCAAVACALSCVDASFYAVSVCSRCVCERPIHCHACQCTVPLPVGFLFGMLPAVTCECVGRTHAYYMRVCVGMCVCACEWPSEATVLMQGPVAPC